MPDSGPLAITCPQSVPVLVANSHYQALLGNYISLAIIPGCSNPVVQSPAPGTVVNPGTVAITLTVTGPGGATASCKVNVTITSGCGN